MTSSDLWSWSLSVTPAALFGWLGGASLNCSYDPTRAMGSSSRTSPRFPIMGFVVLVFVQSAAA